MIQGEVIKFNGIEISTKKELITPEIIDKMITLAEQKNENDKLRLKFLETRAREDFFWQQITKFAFSIVVIGMFFIIILFIYTIALRVL